MKLKGTYSFTLYPTKTLTVKGRTKKVSATDPTNNEEFRIIQYEITECEENSYFVVGDIVNFKGKGLPEMEDNVFEFEGETKTDKYGTFFDVKSFLQLEPQGKKAIISFLKTCTGCGEAKANKIYEKYGDKALSTIDATPFVLMSDKIFTEKVYGEFIEDYCNKKGLRDTMQLLAPYGITATLCQKAYNKYKGALKAEFIDNPYILCNVNGFAFPTVDEIAKLRGISPDNPDRIKACILYVLEQNEISGYNYNGQTIAGNTTMPKKFLLREIKKQLGTYISEALISQCASDLYMHKKIEVSQQNFVSRKYTYECEKLIATKIAELSCMNYFTLADIDKAIRNMEKRENVRLDSSQYEAVKMALTNPVCVLTGGAGCGKTFVVHFIAEIKKQLDKNCNIAFLAPTGKAARRITESTGYDASTIHMALGIRDSENEYEPVNELDDDYIVVDESSMLDVFVASKLLSSLRSNSEILFVGDIAQLPSIGAGSILGDLIKSGIVPVAKLTKTFRQGSDSLILSNATNIKEGRDEIEVGNDFQLAECNSTKEAAKILLALYINDVKKYGIDNVALLSPFRKSTECGADSMNKLIQEAVNPAAIDKDEITYIGTTYRVNDRVMQLKNTPEASNGDIGVIKEITYENGEQVVKIKFDKSIVKYYKTDLDQITLGYAMSIHKSQGSEYKSVIISIMNIHNGMLKRNLLYTAVTRAKEKCTIVGERTAISKAIATPDTNTRCTLLAPMLQFFTKKYKQELCNPFVK